jgi:hypothetical protein
VYTLYSGKIKIAFISIYFYFQKLDAPSSTTIINQIIAFNTEDGSNMSLVIDDGELYPAYQINLQILADFLHCSCEDVQDTLELKLPFQASMRIENGIITDLQ